MEKIEKHLVDTKKGKHMIKATTILDVTLQDYHKSRLLYGNDEMSIKVDRPIKEVNEDNYEEYEQKEVKKVKEKEINNNKNDKSLQDKYILLN
jgi:hypothetical protein